VGELRKKNIKTIVVGFGADTAVGAGPDTLNAMAEAGGFARACPMQTDAECGSNNTCDKASKLCVRKFYQASNAAELAKALQDIIDIVKGMDICTYTLDAVPDDRAIVAESGIRTVDDVRRLKTFRVKAILVGESLLRQNNLVRATKQLAEVV
jgi:hypothetical protein